MSNGYGDYFEMRSKTMADHDALPGPLRRISCYTVGNWAPIGLANRCRQHMARGLTFRQAVARVAQYITDIAEPASTLAAYGASHPEAGQTGATQQ